MYNLCMCINVGGRVAEHFRNELLFVVSNVTCDHFSFLEIFSFPLLDVVLCTLLFHPHQMYYFPNSQCHHHAHPPPIIHQFYHRHSLLLPFSFFVVGQSFTKCSVLPHKRQHPPLTYIPFLLLGHWQAKCPTVSQI